MSDLFKWAEKPLEFDGETYVAPRDEVRLTGQALRVFKVMKDGQWRTLAQIARETERFDSHDSEAAISARLRDFRKDRFGAHTVEREHVTKGLFRYRLLINFLTASSKELL